MKDHKSPFMENSRSSELSNRSRRRDPQAKKLQKIPKKSLSAVLGSEEDGLKESLDFSSASEIMDSNDDSSDVAESLMLPLTPSQSTITDMPDSSEFSQSVSFEVNKIENLNQSFPEVELYGDHFNESQVKVVKSPDMKSQAEMLLDKTTKLRPDDISHTLLPDGRDYFDKMVSIRSRVVCCCFALWVIAIFGILFSSSELQGSYIGPLPT